MPHRGRSDAEDHTEVLWVIPQTMPALAVGTAVPIPSRALLRTAVVSTAIIFTAVVLCTAIISSTLLDLSLTAFP